MHFKWMNKYTILKINIQFNALFIVNTAQATVTPNKSDSHYLHRQCSVS